MAYHMGHKSEINKKILNVVSSNYIIRRPVAGFEVIFMAKKKTKINISITKNLKFLHFLELIFSIKLLPNTQ